MAFQVSLMLKDPPVVLIVVEGTSTPAEIDLIVDSVERVLQEHDLMTTFNYTIVDARKATMALGDVMKITSERDPRRGAIGDPLSRTIFVGTHTMLRITRDMYMHSNTASPIPIFESYEEALAFIREMDAADGHAEARRSQADHGDAEAESD